jgi:hypothetical protein
LAAGFGAGFAGAAGFAGDASLPKNEKPLLAGAGLAAGDGDGGGV